MSARQHDIAWAAPAPLRGGGGGLGRPAILRFATDDFIERLHAVLATAPARLAAYRARPETWREPLAVPTETPAPPQSAAAHKLRRLLAGRAPVPAVAGGSDGGLKLYQPSQMRHYLVAATLVCREPGLPDRRIDLAAGDRAGCVLRRLLPPVVADRQATPPAFDAATWVEHAWTPGDDGAAWMPLADPLAAPPSEERLPLFPMAYEEADGRRRRLLAGSVPTGRREALLGAPVAGTSGTIPAPAAKSARLMLLRADVIEPWRRLIELGEQTERRFGPESRGVAVPGRTATERDNAKKAADDAIARTRDQIQTASWYVLLDLADFLDRQAPNVMRVVRGEPASPNGAEQAVVNTLGAMTLPAALRTTLGTAGFTVATDLRAALAGIGVARMALEAVTQEFSRADGAASPWPKQLFPLADPDPSQPGPAAPGVVPNLTAADGIDADLAIEEPEARQPQQDAVTALEALIVRALPIAGSRPDPALPPTARAGQEPRDAWFVMRCVLDRPGCAPFHGPLVGPPTEPFRIAGFFDPDAPARPVRIGLPLDISPAGLRRFDKKAVVTLSDALCGQLHRMRGLGFGDLVLSVLPWPFHKGLPSGGGAPCTARGDAGLSLGLMCSLSIPIITLCALILLIIMVALLDIVFRWLPWFILCLPIPGLKSKGPR